MENLYKQLRVKYARSEQQDTQEGSNSIRRIPPKSQSFKPERKRAQNWFLRQFSGTMNNDGGSSDGEFETVIAAGAYAITALLEEEESMNKKRQLESSLTKSKSTKEDTSAAPPQPPQPGSISRRFTGKDASRGDEQTADASAKKPEVVDQKSPEDPASAHKLPEKTTSKVPSVKKTLTFAVDDKNSVKPEGSRDTLGRSASSSFAKPTATTAADNTLGGYLNVNRTETKADAWEKDKMAKIKKRFEKQSSTILSWENEKKTRAKQRLHRKEAKLELTRARATQEYGIEMERISKIAVGARAIAEERKRNDEMKTREKTRKIRSTGKVPVTCFCFR